MMIATELSLAAALAVQPVAGVPAEISVSFVQMEDWRDGLAGNYQRYDLRFSNKGATARTLSICPPDAGLIGRESRLNKRLVRQAADGIAFDGARISHNCGAQVIEPGASTVLSVYFSVNYPPRRLLPVVVDTPFGRFLVVNESVVRLDDDGEPTGN